MAVPSFPNVAERLSGRFGEVLSLGLVLTYDHALPNDVDAIVRTLQVFHGPFKAGNASAMDTKDVEEFIPEGLRLGALAGFVFPVVSELNGTLADFLKG